MKTKQPKKKTGAGPKGKQNQNSANSHTNSRRRNTYKRRDVQAEE